MDVSKFRRSTNVRDLRGQKPPAAMTIRGKPSKEVAKSPTPVLRERHVVRR